MNGMDCHFQSMCTGQDEANRRTHISSYFVPSHFADIDQSVDRVNDGLRHDAIIYLAELYMRNSCIDVSEEDVQEGGNRNWCQYG